MQELTISDLPDNKCFILIKRHGKLDMAFSCTLPDADFPKESFDALIDTQVELLKESL